jgi:hypothetical protein
VVKRIFDEADRRDPQHYRTWVALVDGNNHQLDLIQAEAKARQLRVPSTFGRPQCGTQSIAALEPPSSHGPAMSL